MDVSQCSDGNEEPQKTPLTSGQSWKTLEACQSLFDKFLEDASDILMGVANILIDKKNFARFAKKNQLACEALSSATPSIIAES